MPCLSFTLKKRFTTFTFALKVGTFWSSCDFSRLRRRLAHARCHAKAASNLRPSETGSCCSIRNPPDVVYIVGSARIGCRFGSSNAMRLEMRLTNLRCTLVVIALSCCFLRMLVRAIARQSSRRARSASRMFHRQRPRRCRHRQPRPRRVLLFPVRRSPPPQSQPGDEPVYAPGVTPSDPR